MMKVNFINNETNLKHTPPHGIPVKDTQLESNHEETSDKPKLKDSLPSGL